MANEQEILQDTRDALFPDCPIRNVLARVGDKWSLLVLYTLQHKGSLRFKQLQRLLSDISQKSLTQTLRILEEDGFVSRKVYAEVPPRVEYSLTERSMSFLPVVNSLIWLTSSATGLATERARRQPWLNLRKIWAGC